MVKLWKSVTKSIRILPDVNVFKSVLIKYYRKALLETFDQDNVFAWKSISPKNPTCQNLLSSWQCCYDYYRYIHLI